MIVDLIMLLQVPVYKAPSFTIPGNSGIVQHEILNNRRYVLTKVLYTINFYFILHVFYNIKSWTIWRLLGASTSSKMNLSTELQKRMIKLNLHCCLAKSTFGTPEGIWYWQGFKMHCHIGGDSLAFLYMII